jgi:hypothetical protein
LFGLTAKGERLAGVAHDELGLAVQSAFLMQALYCRHLLTLLRHLDTVTYQQQAPLKGVTEPEAYDCLGPELYKQVPINRFTMKRVEHPIVVAPFQP